MCWSLQVRVLGQPPMLGLGEGSLMLENYLFSAQFHSNLVHLDVLSTLRVKIVTLGETLIFMCWSLQVRVLGKRPMLGLRHG